MLFGSLGCNLIENVLKSPHKQASLETSIHLKPIQTARKQTITYNKELAKSAENINSIEISNNKEISLDDLLFELTQETNKVTISKVVIQFLKINSKLDKTHLVLSIVISIVICFKYYFKKFY